MKHEFIKKTEDCRTERCSHCNGCTNMNSVDDKTLAREARTSSDLYDKEVEQYYFYFLENKAS